jgi:hypothetical protein
MQIDGTLGIKAAQRNGEIHGQRELVARRRSGRWQRDHPGTADAATVQAFADAILTLDDSMPTGTCVDMCSRLPLTDPRKLTVPTIILRGEYDGIAGMDDLIDYFRLPRRPTPASPSG